MKILTIVVRVLLGLMFTVFGANAFLRFLPMPPIPQTLAGDFMRVFFASGWVYAIGAVQVLAGVLLLVGRFVPFALTLLGGIIFNIIVFHATMAPEGSAPAVVVTLMWLFLVWRYWASFVPLFRSSN